MIVRTHQCAGFLGFYSTVPSSGLSAKLNASNLPFEVQTFDCERVERLLLSPSGIAVAKRFFPASLSVWEKEHPLPAKIFADEPALSCFYCNKSLLHPKPHGIVVIWTSWSKADDSKQTEHLYWCCKGRCDKALKDKYWHKEIVDGWEDIPDLTAPIAFIRWVAVSLNKFQHGEKYSDEAFKNLSS